MKLLPLFALLLSLGCEHKADCPLHTLALMPENDLHRYDKIDDLTNISEVEFHKSLDEVEAVYKPIVAAQGGELMLEADWQDSTVNAYASRQGKKWVVAMFGGLARRNEITRDAYQLVFLHELGHHLGGFPYAHSWAANDGQSDYFAVQAGAKLLWKGDLDKNAESAKTVFEHPKKQCDAVYSLEADRNLCYRIAQASKSLADLLSSGRAKYDAPDKSKVAQTYNGHPAGQCRLDTMLSASLCQVAWDGGVIPSSEKASAKQLCVEGRDAVGFRPRCWFKPGK